MASIDRHEDLLLQLALEHRDLSVISRMLREHGDGLDPEQVRLAAVTIVEHELAHRLLVHPLLGRDRRGRSLCGERREEQMLLADRLRHALREADAASGGDPRYDRVTGLDHQLIAHADREEIVAFPHVRRVTDPEELHELGALRQRLQDIVVERLLAEDSPVGDGRWASTPRRDLPELLELPDDLVIELPDLETSRPTASA